MYDKFLSDEKDIGCDPSFARMTYTRVKIYGICTERRLSNNMATDHCELHVYQKLVV